MFWADQDKYKILELKKKNLFVASFLNTNNFNWGGEINESKIFKKIQINESRQSIQLDTNRNEYDLKIIVNNTILFNDFVKVKEYVHYEKQ